MNTSESLDALPPLNKDRTYWALTVTQFFGAFNDNLFKQLLLLMCADLALQGGSDLQFIASALFAIPFVLFSGISGVYADRNSKRSIIVLCKVLEIVVMALAMLVFFFATGLSTVIRLQFFVLFLMSTQSAIFGPAKYGVLPELFRERDLPRVNGMIQMTTFIAIIFGMSLAGFTRDWFGGQDGESGQIWIAFSICVGIAVVGTLTSLFVRSTPIADPNLKATVSDWWVGPDMRAVLWKDRPLLIVLVVSSMFWLVGVVVQTSVNEIGKGHFQMNNTRTSFMAACMGLGIAIGCIVAGRISKSVLPNTLVKAGAWGLVFTLATIVVFPAAEGAVVADAGQQADANAVDGKEEAVELEEDNLEAADNAPQESFWAMMIPATTSEFLARGLLLLLGVAAGLFVVPLQVFLQARPPENLKGRMIGAMNLVNWVAIVIGSVLGGILFGILKAAGLPLTWTWFAMAILMLPIALFYRLPAEVNVLPDDVASVG